MKIRRHLEMFFNPAALQVATFQEYERAYTRTTNANPTISRHQNFENLNFAVRDL
jgi:hypothetical protein